METLLFLFAVIALLASWFGISLVWVLCCDRYRWNSFVTYAPVCISFWFLIAIIVLEMFDV